MGKVPFCTLAKSYIKGKITKEDFEEKTRIIINNITFFKDREDWNELLENQRKELTNFTDKCLSADNTNKKICSYCGKKGWIFSPVKEYENNKLYLCNNHNKEIKKLRNFAYYSTYFMISPIIIPLEKNEDINVNLNFIVEAVD